MNPYIHSTEELTQATTDMPFVQNETALLAQDGFTDDEVMSLLWLRQWYQNGGSDRTEIIRRLEFLKLLVLNGQIEL